MLRLIDIYTRRSLEVAGELEQLYKAFASSNRAPHDAGQKRIEAGILTMARAADSTERLHVPLQRQTPWTLMHNVWGSKRIEARQLSGVPFNGWNDVSAALLRGAETDPDTFLTAIVPFVTSESFNGDDRLVKTIDHAALDTLFGAGKDRLLRMIDDWQLPNDLHSSTQQMAEAVRNR